MPRKNRNQADKQRRIDNPEWAEAERKRHREYRVSKKIKAPSGQKVSIPSGQRVKFFSTNRNGAGEVNQEWTGTERASHDPPRFEPVPPDFTVDRIATNLDGQGQVRQQWIGADKKKSAAWDEMWRAINESTARYERWALPTEAPTACLADTATHYNFGDPHLGMLAWKRETGQHFDFKIARQDLIECFTSLVQQSPASKLCLINELGDLYHAEDDKQATPTAGHKLDVDGRAGKLNELVSELLVGVTELALAKHETVEWRLMRGNHDPYKALGAAGFLRAWFRNEPRVVVVDNNNPFLFREFGTNLWGWHHGDGCPPQRIKDVISCYDDGRPWGRTLHRFMATGHIHTDKRFDFAGGWSESFRTLAPADYWAHWKGWRSEQSVDSLTFHIERGLMSRNQVNLRGCSQRKSP